MIKNIRRIRKSMIKVYKKNKKIYDQAYKKNKKASLTEYQNHCGLIQKHSNQEEKIIMNAKIWKSRNNFSHLPGQC